ncbi:MAG: HAD-IA family hydrolase [Candidatus Levyibacteriota bacterium]
MVHKLGFGEIFDGFYASSHIGEIKSNPAFFRRLLKQIEFKPKETLFWDDSPTHVDSAKSVGMHTELYTSYEDFKKKMDKYLN